MASRVADGSSSSGSSFHLSTTLLKRHICQYEIKKLERFAVIQLFEDIMMLVQVLLEKLIKI